MISARVLHCGLVICAVVLLGALPSVTHAAYWAGTITVSTDFSDPANGEYESTRYYITLGANRKWNEVTRHVDLTIRVNSTVRWHDCTDIADGTYATREDEDLTIATDREWEMTPEGKGSVWLRFDGDNPRHPFRSSRCGDEPPAAYEKPMYWPRVGEQSELEVEGWGRRYPTQTAGEVTIPSFIPHRWDQNYTVRWSLRLITDPDDAPAPLPDPEQPWTPPPPDRPEDEQDPSIPDLVPDERKVELAEDGADAAAEGAAGCFATAALVGGVEIVGGALIIGDAAAVAGSTLSRFEKFVSFVVEETALACAVGIVGTVSSGVQLAVDPPDPKYRLVGLATPYPRASPSRCPGSVPRRTCRELLTAARRLAAANAREASIAEAVAVAANRFGNAQRREDLWTAELQRAVWRTYTGLQVAARQATDRARGRLVRTLKPLGISRVRLSRAALKLVRTRSGALRGVPAAVVRRLRRKRLVVSRRSLAKHVRGFAARAESDLLGRRQRSRRAIEVARKVDAQDVALIGRALVAESRAKPGARAVIERELGSLWRCESGGTEALKAFLKDLRRAGKRVLGAEGTILLRAAARHALNRRRCSA